MFKIYWFWNGWLKWQFTQIAQLKITNRTTRERGKKASERESEREKVRVREREQKNTVEQGALVVFTKGENIILDFLPKKSQNMFDLEVEKRYWK